MISVDSISYAYPESYYILNDINLSVIEGDFIGVLGRNGAGKSTFIDLLMGFKHPASGSVGTTDLLESNEIAFLSQAIQLEGNITVNDFLKYHSMHFKKYSVNIQSELLLLFEVDKNSLIQNLSTGQQKITLAIACLASKTKVLIVDEITAVLDPVARHRFFEVLLSFNEKYKLTILLATNIAEDLKGRAKSILYINDCKSEILDTLEVSEIFKI